MQEKKDCGRRGFRREEDALWEKSEGDESCSPRNGPPGVANSTMSGVFFSLFVVHTRSPLASGARLRVCNYVRHIELRSALCASGRSDFARALFHKCASIKIFGPRERSVTIPLNKAVVIRAWALSIPSEFSDRSTSQ